MNKEFWIYLTITVLVLAIGFYVLATVAKTSPAIATCYPVGFFNRTTYRLPDGYDLNFRNPYNVIDTEDGLDVIFHFSKED